MMGIPEEDHQRIFHWTNVILGFGDPDIDHRFRGVRQGGDGYRCLRHRTGRGPPPSIPREDLTTSLVQAEVDGERLTSAEVASFFILLVVAGNETTRNAISHGVLALTRYPEQRARLVGRLRRGGPVRGRGDRALGVTGRSTCAAPSPEDFELSGTKLAAGDKVTLWYCSANRDESKFADPWTFDLRSSSQSARRLRWRWRALLPRRQPRPSRDHRRVRGTAPPDTRYRRRPKSPDDCCRRSSTASSGCRLPGRRRTRRRRRRSRCTVRPVRRASARPEQRGASRRRISPGHGVRRAPGLPAAHPSWL